MKKLLFFFALVLASIALPAQEDSLYLAGAVPETDGKIKYTFTFDCTGIPQERLFRRLEEWSEKRFRTEEDNQGRVLYTNMEKGQIVNQGSEYLVFLKHALALDCALFNYRVTFFLAPGRCDMEVSHLNYVYEDPAKKIPAEEIISDENALYRNGTKLVPGTKKFRIHTVDLIRSLQQDVEQAIAAMRPAQDMAQTPAIAPSQPQPAPKSPQPLSATPDTAAGMEGFTRIEPTEIPGNIIQMLANDWMLVTATHEGSTNMMTASWGGLGHLYNRPMAFCFISPARHTYRLMEKAETYTLTFYAEDNRDALQYCGTHSGRDGDKIQATGLTPVATPSGATAFKEARIVIECRKMLAQSLSPDALHDEGLQTEWSGKAMHKMYIGEITGVWIKQ